jgi:hypothetical protein
MLLIMVEATFASSGAVVEPTATLRRIAPASSSNFTINACTSFFVARSWTSARVSIAPGA